MRASSADEDDDSDSDCDSDRNPAVFRANGSYSPDVDVDELSPEITNELFPAPVGARWTYEAETEDGLERIEIEVLPGTRPTFGAEARIIRDTVTLDGELIEDTFDWFAEDEDGNVWYLGEDTTEYEDGVPVCNCGAWEAGVDGAQPGVIMLAEPRRGDAYRQEFAPGIAEDYARVVRRNLVLNTPAGRFTGCLKTRDLSSLDPTADEFKYYCPGVGLVRSVSGDQITNLISYSGL